MVFGIEIVLPIVPAILGGLAAAVWGAYKSEDEFNTKYFVMSIPKALVAGLVAVGSLAGVSSGVIPDVSSGIGFWAVFSAGFVGVKLVKTE